MLRFTNHLNGNRIIDFAVLPQDDVDIAYGRVRRTAYCDGISARNWSGRQHSTSECWYRFEDAWTLVSVDIRDDFVDRYTEEQHLTGQHNPQLAVSPQLACFLWVTGLIKVEMMEHRRFFDLGEDEFCMTVPFDVRLPNAWGPTLVVGRFLDEDSGRLEAGHLLLA